MEGILMFVSIVMIVFGVLQIILFFKMWGMTNDIARIKEKLNCSNSNLWEIRKALLKNNKVLAKELLLNSLLSDLEQYEKSGGDFDMNVIWKKYNSPFQQLEMEIPENLKNIKSISDIQNIIKFDS